MSSSNAIINFVKYSPRSKEKTKLLFSKPSETNPHLKYLKVLIVVMYFWHGSLSPNLLNAD